MSYNQQPYGNTYQQQQPYQAGPPNPAYGGAWQGQQQQGGYGAPQQGGGGGYGYHQAPHDPHVQPQQSYGQPAYNQTSNSYQPPQQQPPYGGYNNGPPPPQQNTYGNAAYASPHQQYNAPPPPPNQYQNPHISGAGPTIFLGTEVSVLDGMNMGMPPPPPQGYDPTFDVTRIRAATKGFGTDESALIATLAPLSALQTAALARTFEAQVGRSLMDVMEKETRGWFLETLRGLVLGPIGYDCWLIQRACKGTGTHEDLLNEILLDRTNAEIYLLKTAFKSKYNQDLISIVKGELSMKTERMFVMALQGARDESPTVNPHAIQSDLTLLSTSTRGPGTDEIAFLSLFLTRSSSHLFALSSAYPSSPQARHKSLADLIKAEFSGHMRDGLLFIARGYEAGGREKRAAEMLEESMKGMGTKDERLIWRVVRGHWTRGFGEWEGTKRAYRGIYGKELVDRIHGDTSGDYRKLLKALC